MSEFRISLGGHNLLYDPSGLLNSFNNPQNSKNRN